MYVTRGELLIPERYYKATVYFEGMSWYNFAWYTLRILWLLDGLSVGANWISGRDDTWYLFYHLKASGASVTHSEVIDTIMHVYHRAEVIELEDLEERESALTPDFPLPDWLGKDWKVTVGVILVILGLLVILPYGYKRGK